MAKKSEECELDQTSAIRQINSSQPLHLTTSTPHHLTRQMNYVLSGPLTSLTFGFVLMLTNGVSTHSKQSIIIIVVKLFTQK